MLGEINKDFYCSMGWTPDGVPTCTIGSNECDRKECDCRHRKWPTLKQFKEEYGEEWKGAVYTLCVNDPCKDSMCIYSEWSDFPEIEPHPPECERKLVKVCACTPWGKPPNDWRPE